MRLLQTGLAGSADQNAVEAFARARPERVRTSRAGGNGDAIETRRRSVSDRAIARADQDVVAQIDRVSYADLTTLVNSDHL